MPFQVNDEVVYDGPLGRYEGRVSAVDGAAIDVTLDGIGLVRTDEASLTAKESPASPAMSSLPHDILFTDPAVVPGQE